MWDWEHVSDVVVLYCIIRWGWLGGAKVSCILRHRGVQLILAYSWARSAILVAGKGRGGVFLFLLFLHFHSYSSFFPVPLSHLLYYLFSLGDNTKWPTRVNVSLNPNTINQYYQIIDNGQVIKFILFQQSFMENTKLPWKLIMKSFLWSFTSFCWFKKGSYWLKYVYEYWLTTYRRTKTT